MAYSTIMSIGSFSVILFEAFTAVGLSSLMPTTAITLARMSKPDDSGAADDTTEMETSLAKTPVNGLKDLLKNLGKAGPDSLDILMPSTAKIHAEFEFQGRDESRIEGSIGGFVEVVNVNVGFSALYESTSRNKITLDVDFVSVNVPI